MLAQNKTKSTTKAGKIKRKRSRGRPRIIGVDREPNGRISRSKKKREPADKLTIEMRAKHTGLSVDAAKDPLAGTYIGRLYMLGNTSGGISRGQYDAAIKFLEIDNNYKKALQSPGAYYDDRCSAEDEGAYAAFCIKAKKQYNAAMDAVKEAQFDNNTDNLYAALQYVVQEDQELPHLVYATRHVLNVLDRHFSLAKRCH